MEERFHSQVSMFTPQNVLNSKASLTFPLCSGDEFSLALFDSSKIMEKGWYLLLYRLKRMYCNVERDIVRMGQNMQKSKACVEAVSSISNVPMVSSKKECLFWMLKPEIYIYFTNFKSNLELEMPLIWSLLPTTHQKPDMLVRFLVGFRLLHH